MHFTSLSLFHLHYLVKCELIITNVFPYKKVCLAQKLKKREKKLFVNHFFSFAEKCPFQALLENRLLEANLGLALQKGSLDPAGVEPAISA